MSTPLEEALTTVLKNYPRYYFVTAAINPAKCLQCNHDSIILEIYPCDSAEQTLETYGRCLANHAYSQINMLPLEGVKNPQHFYDVTTIRQIDVRPVELFLD